MILPLAPSSFSLALSLSLLSLSVALSFSLVIKKPMWMKEILNNTYLHQVSQTKRTQSSSSGRVVTAIEYGMSAHIVTTKCCVQMRFSRHQPLDAPQDAGIWDLPGQEM